MAFVTSRSFAPALVRRQRPTSARFTCKNNIDPHIASKPLAETLRKPVRVALTREQGKNAALYQSLELVYPTIEIVHTPCVETTRAEHSDMLPDHLKSTASGWIVVTSPEAASVVVGAWRKADYPQLGRIAAVGKATGDILRAVGLELSFIPSKATGKALVKEMPVPSVEKETVLYPASAKASDDIVNGLSKRGYSVLRLNTYSTETAKFNDDMKVLAEGTHVVTFASPSAVTGWVSNVGVNDKIAVACIGSTSANAARAAGFQQIHFPDNPGMEGWIQAISEAMKSFGGLWCEDDDLSR